MSNLSHLLSFLEKDPENPQLLTEASWAAYHAQDVGLANRLIGRVCGPLPASLLHLKGLLALTDARYGDAAEIFRELRASSQDTPALRFNLAWAEAMQERFGEALDLLDDAALDAAPLAPMLKIRAMHHLGLYEEALICGDALAKRYPGNEALMGALATLALDAEKADLAQRYAERAGNNAEGRAALGFLTLGAHDTARSLEMFDNAIAATPNNARAWIGKGLGLLVSGQAAEGTKALDRGAALFENHVGSWIASGWAHFVAGDYVKARESFGRAKAVDPNFSECHGGVAVLDIAEGRIDDAKRETEIALRLDRNCFGGALAKSLLLERGGHSQAAKKIREIAFSTPIGPGGRTIAQELIAFNIGANRRDTPKKDAVRK